jgi:hypothetical protein
MPEAIGASIRIAGINRRAAEWESSDAPIVEYSVVDLAQGRYIVICQFHR